MCHGIVRNIMKLEVAFQNKGSEPRWVHLCSFESLGSHVGRYAPCQKFLMSLPESNIIVISKLTWLDLRVVEVMLGIGKMMLEGTPPLRAYGKYSYGPTPTNFIQIDDIRLDGMTFANIPKEWHFISKLMLYENKAEYFF